MLAVNNYQIKNKEMSGIKKIWQAALYVRLSREDGDKEESNSISNQRELLQQFLSCEPDILEYGIYVDDGWSGTNFDRPEFQRMINDIRDRKVDCVIVKDLSRFGRNYIDAGQYIEKIFPLLNVRFIAVTDCLDSVKNPQSMNNIMVPFKNLINDEYCRDISNKVRSSLDLKRKQGKHIGSFACYGYKKDPDDHNHLVIDEEAAEVVKCIFKWYISGMSIIAIAKKLNSMNIPNPSTYKKMQGLNYKNSFLLEANQGQWPDSTVRRILGNRMYVGDLVQGVLKIKSYKVQVAERQKKSDWIIVEDTHEAIISKKDFQTVQELLNRNMRAAPQKTEVSLFSGYVKCGDCGRSMSRKNHSYDYGVYNYFVCTTYSKINKELCTKHTMRVDKLEEIVLASIQAQVALAVDMDKAITMINASSKKNMEAVKLRKSLESLKSVAESKQTMLLELYPDWKRGIISKEEYVKLKEHIEKQRDDAFQKVQELEQKILDFENGQDGSNQFIENFIKYKNLNELTREVIVALIDMIYIYENKKVKIVFKYQSPFKTCLDFIQNNRKILGDECVMSLPEEKS